MINTMKHYYLINNKIMKGSEMPHGEDYVSIKPTFFNKTWFDSDTKQWLSSLQPCEISSIEMDKIEMYLSKNMSTYFDCTTPIDVTDIVEEIDKFQEICSICHKTIKEQAKGCNLIECYKGRPNYKRVELFFKQPSDNNGVITFKQPKQVDGEIEAVEFLEWTLSAGYKLNPHCEQNRWNHIDNINSNKPLMTDGYTTKQLYEIFKNR